MQKKDNVKITDIENTALYCDETKESLSTQIGKKEEYRKRLLKLEYQWILTNFPRDIIILLRNFIDTGTIYILVDDKLRSSLSTYISTIILILEEERDKNTKQEKFKQAGRVLEEILIPYFQDFCSQYPAGAIVFHILIKRILSIILRNQTVDRKEEFISTAENTATLLTNTVLSIVTRKSTIPADESDVQFIENFLKRIPVYAQKSRGFEQYDLKKILSTKGLSQSLFKQLQNVLLDELKQTIEKNLLQTLLSQEVESKEELFNNIDIPISRRASSEITTALKQAVTRRLSSLEGKRLEYEKELQKNFEGFNETSELLWNSINTEIKNIREGKISGSIEEVTERSSVLSAFIKKKMWSIQEIIRRKKKIDTIIKNLRELETLKKDEIVKYSKSLEQSMRIESLANFYFAFVKHYGKNLTKLPDKVMNEAEKILKQSERGERKEIIENFYEKHFITNKYFPERYILRFLKCFEDHIIPLYIEESLMGFFAIWPPIFTKQASKKALPHLEKEVVYVGDYLIPEGKYLTLGTFPVSPEKELLEKDTYLTTNLINNFSKMVCVLVYDIRGSTFMGTKLGNAKMESSIRKKFSAKMLEIADKYGAFPVKDTGDGGILFFGENSRELYGKIFSPAKIGNEWIRANFSKEDLLLKEGEDVAKYAILTAKEMILEAQRFVSKNIHEYSDWFKEGKERKLFFKGMNYAQLPPSYKRIFQIGIGITSGRIEKDVHFSINAFGDPDITGTLVRDANLFSKARHPDSSVILIDSATFLNLLLNQEIVEPIIKEQRIGDFSDTEIYRYLIDKTLTLAKSRSQKVAYRLKKQNAIIERIGCRILDEEKKDDRIVPSVTVSDLELTITDTGAFKDKKGGFIKFLYEVSFEV
jgi:hypothetical protein